MTRFRFRLETVLKMRGQREEMAQQQLAARQQHQQACRERLDRTRHHLEMLMQSSGQVIDVQGELERQCYREHLEKRGQQEEAALTQCLKEVKEARQNLLKMRQDRLVLDKLKEKKYALHCAELRALEVKHMDEAGAKIAQKNKAKGGD